MTMMAEAEFGRAGVSRLGCSRQRVAVGASGFALPRAPSFLFLFFIFIFFASLPTLCQEQAAMAGNK